MADFPSGRFVDPSYLAEIQAQVRGFGDLEQDTGRERRYLRQDTRTQRRDLRQDRSRGMEDFATELERGFEDIGFERADILRDSTRGREDITRSVGRQRQDVTTDAGRAREDFGHQLEGLLRNYDRLGRTQSQAINAAGVSLGSTRAASAAAREGNLAFDRQPIDTGLQRVGEDETRAVGRLDQDLSRGLGRLGEDTTTALGRLDVAGNRLGEDVGRGRERLTQDVSHDLRLANQGENRGLRDIELERGRGRRELIFSGRDLGAQARFNARLLRKQMNPYVR